MRPVIQLPTRNFTVNDNIDTIRELLIDSVGAYCAYCESPLTIDMPWSYLVSISNKLIADSSGTEQWQSSPRLNDDWRNFHAICFACHRARFPILDFEIGLSHLDEQTANTLRTDARSIRGLVDGQIAFLFNATRQSLVWPQLMTDLDGLVLAPGDDTWNLLAYQVASRSQIDLANAGLVRLSTEETGQPWAATLQNMIWVIPNETYIGQLPDADDVRGRVRATILHFNLNHHDGSFHDTRVANRTTAFAEVQNAFNALTGIVQNVRGNNAAKEEDLEHQNVLTYMQAIRETVRATGFWSVWASAFRFGLFNAEQNNIWNSYPVDARNAILYSLFVEHEVETNDAENAFVEVLPGTDPNRLPF